MLQQDTTFELSAVDNDGSTATVSVEAELDEIISTLNFSSLEAGTTLSIISGVDDVSGTGGTISGVFGTAITPIVITGTIASNLVVSGTAQLTGAPPGWDISSSNEGNVITMTITGNHPETPATWNMNLEGWNLLTVPTASITFSGGGPVNKNSTSKVSLLATMEMLLRGILVVLLMLMMG